ncbi:MAG: hypothetical protein RIQ89_938 [Bacteroidota bacterium]|jgi:Na+/proline symporter
MNPNIILTCVVLYTLLLFYIVWLTGKNASNETYFIGNRNSKWYLVAYGMIGASLSGVTFMSVPGDVAARDFTYFQMVLGYLLGYLVIAFVLLPIYYKMQLTSIYTYLHSRFGQSSYRTGAFFFILSRVIGASFRMFIVVYVLQRFMFDTWNVPFVITVAIFIALILLYTYQGGVKTIVWTDTLQTTFMLLSLILTVILISNRLDFDFSTLWSTLTADAHFRIIETNVNHKFFFAKDFFGGMFIAIAMTGLDQEMMQKNISVKTLGGSQKNMMVFSIILIVVNFLFLVLGVLLLLYAQKINLNLPSKTDDLFPTIALNTLGTISAILFIIGLISAAFPSADGALTALTASFCIDFLNLEKRNDWSIEKKTAMRKKVHFGFAAILLITIMLFYWINDEAVVRQVFKFANYTYGPLLGMFFFGILTDRKLTDHLAPFICLLSPILCYALDANSTVLFNGYKFGNELLILNGLFTFIGMLLISKRAKHHAA